MPLIASGRLNQRVTILEKTVVRGPLGGHDETYAPLITVWAEILDMTGRQIFDAKALGSEATQRVTIRWNDDITEDQRVQYSDGSIARIEWIRRVLPRQWIELYCLNLNE